MICEHGENPKHYTNLTYRDFIVICLPGGLIPFTRFLFPETLYPERVTIPRKAFS